MTVPVVVSLWDVIEFADGSHMLNPAGADIPLGGVVVAQTANPDYLTPVAPVVPQTITPWQARKALNAWGIRDAVEAYIAAQDRDTRDGWEFATELLRDDAMLNAAAPLLGIDLDEFFTFAATL